MDPSEIYQLFCTYLEINIAILIFGIGLPAFITQTIVEEDILVIVNKRNQVIGVSITFSLIIILSSVFAVLMFQFMLFGNRFRYWYMICSMFIWIILLIFLIFQFSMYQRKRLVSQLTKRIIRNLKKNNIKKASKGLNNLKLLGVEGKSGQDKNLIIKAYWKIVEFLLQSPDYAGKSLGDIFKHLKIILRTTTNFGNLHNFYEVLDFIISHLATDEIQDEHSPDLFFAFDFAIALSHASLKKYDFITMGLVELLKDPLNNHANYNMSARALAEIGLEALRVKSNIILLKILNIFPESVSTPFSQYHYLGLLAAVWVEHNSILKDEIAKRIRDIEVNEDQLQKAVHFHKQTGQFDLARHIQHLRRQLYPVN